eukprot:366577-Chlamydomonas_euryale.AAC.21
MDVGGCVDVDVAYACCVCAAGMHARSAAAHPSPPTRRPHALAGQHGSCNTCGCLLKQAIDHGPRQRHRTVVVVKPKFEAGRA